MPSNFAARLCLRQDILKVTPLGISKKMLDIASQPIFDACFSLLGMSFECVRELGDHFVLHLGPKMIKA
ncbi:hypothetical protein RHODOP_01823 [Rhodoplanes sp. P11]